MARGSRSNCPAVRRSGCRSLATFQPSGNRTWSRPEKSVLDRFFTSRCVTGPVAGVTVSISARTASGASSAGPAVSRKDIVSSSGMASPLLL